MNVNNYDESIFYLLKYKNDKSYIVIDSTEYQKNTFFNDSNYPEGIYVIANHDKYPLFEILLDKDQKFSINIKEPMDLSTYKIRGCKVTSDYFDIYTKTIYYNIYINALESELYHFPENINKIDSLTNLLHEYQESKLKNGDSFLNTYIKFIEKITIPKELKDNDIAIKEYIINHYFDELPLCDERILNSTLLKNKLDDYFDNILNGYTSDFTCKKIDDLLLKVSECHNVRDYILWNLYSRYFNNEDLRHEETFIHLADKYFSCLEINNLTPNIRKRIIERANILRNITIGKIIPDFSFIDTDSNPASLKDIDSNKIIIFFHKSDCTLCHKSKRILTLIEKKYDDVKIIDVNITDEEANREIISRYDIMNVPTIYILDEGKRVITKNIDAEEVEYYLIKR